MSNHANHDVDDEESESQADRERESEFINESAEKLAESPAFKKAMETQLGGMFFAHWASLKAFFMAKGVSAQQLQSAEPFAKMIFAEGMAAQLFLQDALTAAVDSEVEEGGCPNCLGINLMIQIEAEQNWLCERQELDAREQLCPIKAVGTVYMAQMADLDDGGHLDFEGVTKDTPMNVRDTTGDEPQKAVSRFESAQDPAVGEDFDPEIAARMNAPSTRSMN